MTKYKYSLWDNCENRYVLEGVSCKEIETYIGTTRSANKMADALSVMHGRYKVKKTQIAEDVRNKHNRFVEFPAEWNKARFALNKNAKR